MKISRAIYEPRGAAAEYSPLAVNLYRGCGHGCGYCYAPACLRTERASFHGSPAPRTGILDALRRDAGRLRGDPRPVLLCFTCDPYQPLEAEVGLTRRAVEVLAAAGAAVRILTKNAPLAIARDVDALTAAGVDFGQTIIFTSEADRRRWEPHAAPIAERIGAMEAARAAGLRTWLSLEPVIDPAQALDVIDRLAPTTDRIMVGKLNHDPRRERAVDWRAFLAEALRRLTRHGCGYTIKDALWRYADAEIRGAWPRTAGG